MSEQIQKTMNSNSEADLSDAIALNAATSTTLSVANNRRINFTISNLGNQLVWLKFQAASVDNDKKGIALFARSFYEIPVDNMYTGEISAIADVGTPDVYLTEY